MTFTVTYRGADGALREEAVEAAGRAECFAQCRARGIVPVSVKEGKRKGGGKNAASPKMPAKGGAGRPGSPRQPGQPRQPGRKARTWGLGVLGVLGVLAIVAGSAWWWLGVREGARPAGPEAPRAAKAVKEVKAVKEAKAPKAPTNAPTAKPAAAKAEETPATNAPPPFVKRPGALQLPDGKVLTFPPPKEGEIRKVYAYGHMYECDHEGNFRDVTKRQLFKTAFEANFLGLAVADKPFIPAFLKGLEQEDVKKTLLKPYEAKGDETEDEMAQLKAYDDMRAAALQYMEEGGTFDEFVDYFAKQVKDERETNALCLREVMTLYKQGKIAEAKEMAEAANALKKQKGLKELKLPAHVRERLGL